MILTQLVYVFLKCSYDEKQVWPFAWYYNTGRNMFSHTIAPYLGETLPATSFVGRLRVKQGNLMRVDSKRDPPHTTLYMYYWSSSEYATPSSNLWHLLAYKCNVERILVAERAEREWPSRCQYGIRSYSFLWIEPFEKRPAHHIHMRKVLQSSTVETINIKALAC
jgi:hypothetical protein